ncbi:GNAT family N-acetyltransferase [Marinicella rhabdoformis]|uniref:GNAT family N-acetyltransferase n=1 Tax=Marinicella rhabdoformis TaxID=2580566 RepID=UPI0012AEC29A|nr:GNAT family N-acetyltransferase [Marinicella rhabdoformis]
MVIILSHQDESIAQNIFQVFQDSYQIEASLIGVDDFPPLSRSAEAIQNSTTDFYGFFEGEDLAAVIEVNHTVGDYSQLKICSLTVDPKHFRKGIAGQLIQYVFSLHEVDEYIVETAVVNKPAIKLYEKHGFTEYKQYLPDHGIPKTVMKRSFHKT